MSDTENQVSDPAEDKRVDMPKADGSGSTDQVSETEVAQPVQTETQVETPGGTTVTESPAE